MAISRDLSELGLSSVEQATHFSKQYQQNGSNDTPATRSLKQAANYSKQYQQNGNTKESAAKKTIDFRKEFSDGLSR